MGRQSCHSELVLAGAASSNAIQSRIIIEKTFLPSCELSCVSDWSTAEGVPKRSEGMERVSRGSAQSTTALAGTPCCLFIKKQDLSLF